MDELITTRPVGKGPLINAMTVDVEDYFQVSAFESHIDRSSWNDIPNRVEANVTRILQLFSDYGVHGTFFTLGWIAQRYPNLIRRIVEAGHEIASHGMEHIRVFKQTPIEFLSDIRNSKRLLQDITGKDIVGYRAASYSIGSNNIWALDVLQEAGYEYSSSIFPIRHDLYGMPEAPRFAFQRSRGGVLEVPITTVAVGKLKLPCGGGGYFRLLPYRFYRSGLKHVNNKEHESGVFYFHPWEIDPDQPRIPGIGIKTRIRHYINLARMEGKIIRLLKDFKWGRMDEVFLNRAECTNNKESIILNTRHLAA